MSGEKGREAGASAGDCGGGGGAPAGLRMRPAGPEDEAPLLFFFDTVLRRDYFLRRGQLSEILVGTHHRVLIAEIDSVLVGVAILTANTRLVNALVHPAYRGLGIGRALVEHSGAREIRAKLDMSTGDPRGFYRSLGFRSTGVRNEKGNIEVMRKRRVRRGAGTEGVVGRGAEKNEGGEGEPEARNRHSAA